MFALVGTQVPQALAELPSPGACWEKSCTTLPDRCNARSHRAFKKLFCLLPPRFAETLTLARATSAADAIACLPAAGLSGLHKRVCALYNDILPSGNWVGLDAM